MKIFIVHMCREGKVDEEQPVGFVEEAGSDVKQPFCGFPELCHLLSSGETSPSIAKRSLNL